MPKPQAAPRLLESQVQEQIVEGLEALGCTVLVTSARKVRGGYGADHGVPDLLVASNFRHLWAGLEVKRPGPVQWSHPEQERLWKAGKTAVVRSLEEAVFALIYGDAAAYPASFRQLAARIPAERWGEVFFGF